MPNPKPYFRKFDSWWYVQTITPEGKRRQIKLVKGLDQKDQAFQRFYELMAQKDPASAPDRSRVNVASYCDLFLEWQEKHQSAKTFEWYQRFLQNFCDVSGTVTVADLKPFHVTRWVDSHSKWGQSTQRAAMTCIKRVFNWAVVSWRPNDTSDWRFKRYQLNQGSRCSSLACFCSPETLEGNHDGSSTEYGQVVINQVVARHGDV